MPGADAIHAFADLNNNGVQNPTERFDDVSKAWIVRASTPGQVTGGGQTLHGAIVSGLTFGFNAFSNGVTTKGQCNTVDQHANVHIKCVDVTTLVETPTHATFFNNASINGAATQNRIDVDDITEPGAFRGHLCYPNDKRLCGWRNVDERQRAT